MAVLDPARQVADVFRTHHGSTPRVVASAPGRVVLIGDHVDYHGGPSLALALEERCHAAVGPRRDGRLTVRSRQRSEVLDLPVAEVLPGTVGGWVAYAAGAALGVLGHLTDLDGDDAAGRGLDVVVDSTVPLGAGLSSSAALTCSVATAVAGLLGHELDDHLRGRLARLCVAAENDFAGAPTGGLDQTVSMFARAGHLVRVEPREAVPTHVPLRLEAAGLALLVLDSRVSHDLADGGYATRRRESEAAATALGLPLRRVAEADDGVAGLDRLVDPLLRRRAQHVVTECQRVDAAATALVDDDWSTLGRLMNRSHASLRDDYEVSCPEIDLACEAALSCGALGARLTGGGFSGSAVVLCRAADVADVDRGVRSTLDLRGMRPPVLRRVRPSLGAG